MLNGTRRTRKQESISVSIGPARNGLHRRGEIHPNHSQGGPGHQPNSVLPPASQFLPACLHQTHNRAGGPVNSKVRRLRCCHPRHPIPRLLHHLKLTPLQVLCSELLRRWYSRHSAFHGSASESRCSPHQHAPDPHYHRGVTTWSSPVGILSPTFRMMMFPKKVLSSGP
jgi:hypothetical protein